MTYNVYEDITHSEVYTAIREQVKASIIDLVEENILRNTIILDTSIIIRDSLLQL